jgi:hypothetical protein
MELIEDLDPEEAHAGAGRHGVGGALLRTAIDIARRQGGVGFTNCARRSRPADALRDLRLVAKASTPPANRSSTLRPIKQLDDDRYRIWRSPVSDAF